jgi:hypothetical protein
MAPADNEHRRRAAARLFAVAGPPVATRLQWIEEDAADFVRVLEGGQKADIGDMRRWAKRTPARLAALCADNRLQLLTGPARFL